MTWGCCSNPAEVLEILLGSWFEPHDHMRETLEVETDLVAGRDRQRYRFRVENDDGERSSWSSTGTTTS